MIYLDNGATSYPKPDVVADAVFDYIKNVGSNINRGGYASAYSAAEVVLETRQLINKMMNGYGPRNTIFTPGLKVWPVRETVFLPVQWNTMQFTVH